MDLDLNEEQKLIQETARDFATAELEPAAAALDAGGDQQVFYDNLHKLAELGFMGLNVRDEYGGAEAGTCPSQKISSRSASRPAICQTLSRSSANDPSIDLVPYKLVECIERMPKWIPATDRGKKVNFQVILSLKTEGQTVSVRQLKF